MLPLAAGLVLGLVALLGVGSSLGKAAAVTEAAELSAADCKQSCIVASAKLSQCMSNCSTSMLCYLYTAAERMMLGNLLCH